LLSADTHAAACQIAALPQTVRGFGPVKDAAITRAAAERATLWAALSRSSDPVRHAAE
jgi:indolepyruvate ferredoxin oxidoreductase